jgi:Dual specificity phosphatase, catalytic domain
MSKLWSEMFWSAVLFGETPQFQSAESTPGPPTQPAAGATQPTAGPTQPTAGSTQPTAGPTQPTAGPTQPTAGPSHSTGDGVLEKGKGGLKMVLAERRGMGLVKNEMAKIDDRIYLGDNGHALSISQLMNNNIGVIISMAAELGFKHFPNTIRYKHYALHDDCAEIAIPALIGGLGFILDLIRDEKSDGPNILIHCMMGRSRSAALAIFYVMYTRNMGFEEAMSFVKSQRPTINPNFGFRSQLLGLQVLVGARLPINILQIIALFFTPESPFLPVE